MCCSDRLPRTVSFTLLLLPSALCPQMNARLRDCDRILAARFRQADVAPHAKRALSYSGLLSVMDIVTV
jgi:hypothetical protein